MSSSKQRVKGESLHLHSTCRSRAEACQGDGDDGVILERDSDHRCPSAERTAPPRSTHVRDGRRLLHLDPARRKERLRKAAPTAARRRGAVDATVFRQGFAKHVRRRRCVGEGRGCALSYGVLQPSPHPSIYRGKGKGGRPSRENPRGGGGQGVGGLPPKQRGCAPFRVSPPPLGAWAQGGGCAKPTRGWLLSPRSPSGPPGGVAPPGGPPESFRWSRYNTGMTPKLSGARLTTSHI